MYEENTEVLFEESASEDTEIISETETIIQEDTETALSGEETLLEDTETSTDITDTEIVTESDMEINSEIDTETNTELETESTELADEEDDAEPIQVVTQTVEVDMSPVVTELQYIRFELLIIIFLILFFWLLNSARNGLRNLNKWTK